MGIVHPGAPRKLAAGIRDLTGTRTFVETGTCRGATTRWAADNFTQVISIEIDPGLYLEAKTVLQDKRNVELHLGPSENLLKEIVPALSAPAIFWLDAHWAGPGTGGENREYPLLNEIAIIDNGPHEHIIMIDDARYLLNQNLTDGGSWPTLVEVTDRMAERHPNSYVVIHDDVVLRVPLSIRSELSTFLQNRTIEGRFRNSKHAAGNWLRARGILAPIHHS